MIRIRPSILLAGLLIFAILMPQAMEAASFALLPPSALGKSFFSQLLTAVHIGKMIYAMDAFDRCSMDKLKGKLLELSSGSGAPAFEIGNAGFKNSGFTRHYLFDINGRILIMRICLTSELGLQLEIPEKDIITRGEIESAKATYQVFDFMALPEAQKPQPRATFHSREVEGSS